jgi:hypothetical protein
METLYHYCSTASFHAIIQSRALWLSSLSNDTMEGKLVARTIARLAERDSLAHEKVRLLQRAIGFYEEAFDGLGFCLSEEDDLLSQWRGYAGNATGVAIGFSVEYLKGLCRANKGPDHLNFTLQKVEYKPSAHEERIEPTYLQVTQLIEDGTLKEPHPTGMVMTAGLTDQQRKDMEADNRKIITTLHRECIPFLLHLFFLKSKAFEEEREWRILSLHVNNGEYACSHRIRDNRVVPYCAVKLEELECSPIVEVILGPKHGTPPKIVENFLKLNGYGLVKVKRSEASYR